ncbi:MAG: hypothetical protein IPK82_05180 [Polyangiaceae bacterium]|nr:hypothetical protein [Polyangiaceae bacterium]
MRRFITLFTLAAAGFFTHTASALVVPPARHSSPLGAAAQTGALVAPVGSQPLRHEAYTSYSSPPKELVRPWGAFSAQRSGGRWQALWDNDTHQPIRIFGGYVEAPGSSTNGTIAEEHARAFLTQHSQLLLSGQPLSNFELVTHHEENGYRTLGFQQVAFVDQTKVPVVGGQVNLRYKADRLFVIGSETYKVPTFPSPTITAAKATQTALSFINAAPKSEVVSVELVILPLVRSADVQVELAYRVATHQTAPESLTDVYIHARTGEVLATRENIRFLTGSVKIEAPVRGPAEHAFYPAPSADLAADGIAYKTNATGAFALDPAAQSLTCYAKSDVVNVVNTAGDGATLTVSPQDGQEVIWSLKDDELGDAQLSGFVHASIAKDYARVIDPNLAFLNKTLPVRVNQDDADYMCNAYWNGASINFFQAFQFCNNTARLADVVYHEFGHAFHTTTVLAGVGSVDPALGEGGADYFASVVTNDPYLAPGFYKSGDYLREFDSDRRWPDDISWDPHETGLIFAGAMWDLRTLLEGSLGPAEGPALAHTLYHDALRRATNVPSSFVEVLAADDDDGDLSNGTPHVCEIVQAFAPHGLTPYISASSLTMKHEPLRILPGQGDAYDVNVELTYAFAQCATDDNADGIDVLWRTQATGGKSPMQNNGGMSWVGKIPGQVAGNKVWYTLAAHKDGLSSYLPQNIADPEYQVFIGDVKPLYCTQFEDGAADWTFGELSGKTTDFQVGTPYGKGGDPAAAYSGNNVLGTSLSELGLYRKSRQSYADSPIVDITGHSHVRVQFMRWLTVEDSLYDQSNVLLNGQERWLNYGTDGTESPIAHEDLEWRFQDIDATGLVTAGATSLQVRFQLTSDEGTEFGGWNIDDFCIVAWEPPPPSNGEGGGGAGGTGGIGGAGVDDIEGGCSCQTYPSNHSTTPWGFAGLTALATIFARRRRNARLGRR